MHSNDTGIGIIRCCFMTRISRHMLLIMCGCWRNMMMRIGNTTWWWWCIDIETKDRIQIEHGFCWLVSHSSNNCERENLIRLTSLTHTITTSYHSTALWTFWLLLLLLLIIQMKWHTSSFYLIKIIYVEHVTTGERERETGKEKSLFHTTNNTAKEQQYLHIFSSLATT